ncbi:hypothetical protein TrLO_g4931 [Triparma laevis f. longispina]|uniref:Uncharacterized protein n=1 Tax=Triparma laevis f. longispina TaxID=1714387 RepID=A0A9W7C7M3_9STRA|nr:hypothetical protein TrLO_g4931 [Triparma laevis f. longispina]
MGKMPTSIGLLASLTDLKLDLNDFSGRILSSISIWPPCESVPSLIGTYTRGRHEVIPDASALVNVGHACFKLVGVILIAPVGLLFTYWHAESNFERQTTFIRLSSSMKSASDGLLLPSIEQSIGRPIAIAVQINLDERAVGVIESNAINETKEAL